MRIVSIVGHKKSGKTRLIERLIPILRSRGYRVGTVKHAPHTLIGADPQADSSRHRAAGAERTLLIGEDGAALFYPFDEGRVARAIGEAFPGFDIVLVEGYKAGPFPKIEVYRRTGDAPPLAATLTVDLLVAKEPHPPLAGIPVRPPDDVEGIARFIERL